MCGRYSLFTDIGIIESRFKVEFPEIEKRYNIAPTQDLPVIINQNGKRIIKIMRWGLIPSFAKDISIGSRMINARAETLLEKVSYKRLLEKNRCLVIANGFYEWEKIGKEKIPYLVSLKNCEPFSFAGLWDSYRDENGKTIYSFTIITVDANEKIKKYHDRMPVMLKEEEEGLWLNNELKFEKVKDLLKPISEEDIEIKQVSKKANYVDIDDESVINIK